MDAKNIKIPNYAAKALKTLEEGGFEAWCVGGCVRDAVCGIVPHDWDICTNALPEEMMKLFGSYYVIPTGIKHGTVTVVIDKNPIEITTYRTDGEYTAHRAPEQVKFVRDIRSDLERRDFTINAMCLDLRGNFYDPFGGLEDISRKILRCVGDPRKRFDEDALRILRLVRFCAKTGFETDVETERAAMELKGLLDFISAERLYSELRSLLIQPFVRTALEKYREIIAQFIPEIRPCFDFSQHNPHHCYDVFGHIVRAVESCRPDPTLRTCMLLHDIAKPAVFTMDEQGIGHFKHHPHLSAEYADTILKRLKSDNETRKCICALIKEHDNRIPADKRSVKRFIAKYSHDFFMDYLEVRRADTLAQSDFQREKKLAELDALALEAIELKENNECLKLSQLGVDGRDMIALGLSGSAIGDMLKFLLASVIEEKAENEKESLISLAQKKMAEEEQE